MALDRAAGRLYVCESGSIKVIDTTTFAVLASATAPMSAWWFSVASDPDRHHLYVTNIYEASPNLFVLDDRDLTTVATIPLPTATRFAIAVDPVTHYLFVAGGQNAGQAFTSALSAIDPDTLKVAHQTSMAGYVLGMALAPARHRIYLTDNTGWRLYGVDDATFTVAETMRLSFAPGELLMHADGRLFVGEYENSSRVDSSLLALDLANHPPIFGTLTFSPTFPTTSDTVRVDAPAYDPDFSASLVRDPVTYRYEWARNGAPIAGATTSTLDLSVVGNGNRGDTITVAVTATDPQGASTSENGTFVIANAAPLVAAHLNTTSPRTNDTLTLSSNVSDADGDPLTIRYEWLRNGSVVPGATSNTFDLTVLGDHGDTITARVIAADDHGAVSAVSLDAVVVDTVPTVTLGLDNQSPRTNDVLTATASGADPDADVLSYDFEFWLNGNYVSSGMYSSNVSSWNLAYAPFGNRGDTITMYVSAWDGIMWGPRTSASAVIVNSPPDATVTLNNKTPTAKAVLVATAAGSDADGDPMTFTYTWQVGKKVKQTTTTTATTSAFDLAGKVSNGDVVTVTVTATDGYVSSAAATDTATVTNNPRH